MCDLWGADATGPPPGRLVGRTRRDRRQATAAEIDHPVGRSRQRTFCGCPPSPSSPLYVFDPAQPWTAGTPVKNRVIQEEEATANPRMLLRMGSKDLAGTHKMFAAVTGANGMVYFGGQWVRDGACGGLAWYDPQTGKVAGLWRPLSNYQITHLATADDGRYVVLSTRRVDDPVLQKPKPEQGALFFLDTKTQELSGPFEPVPRAKAPARSSRRAEPASSAGPPTRTTNSRACCTASTSADQSCCSPSRCPIRCPWPLARISRKLGISGLVPMAACGRS